MAWNVAVDQRPEIVVLPETVSDVVATIELAGDAGLRVAPQGTGHNAGALGDLTGTVLCAPIGCARSPSTSIPARCGSAPVGAERFYDRATLARLRRIRERHDPRMVIRSNHSWAD